MDAIPVPRIAWALLFRLSPHVDERGLFIQISAAGARAVGVAPEALAQDNSLARSARGVLRGLHVSRADGEAQLVRRPYRVPTSGVRSRLRLCRHVTASRPTAIQWPVFILPQR